MGNDTLGAIIMAQVINLIDAPNDGWTEICKTDTPWDTLPRDTRSTIECRD